MQSVKTASNTYFLTWILFVWIAKEIHIVVENGLLGTATKLQTSLLHHESYTPNTAGHRTSTSSCNSLVGDVHA